MGRRASLLAAAAALVATTAWGQAGEGLGIFTRPDKGNCVACHEVPAGAGPAIRATVGPRLDGARLKAWDRARLRALLVDPMVSDPDTVMPPFGRHRLLSPQEIERLIDYLHALP